MEEYFESTGGRGDTVNGTDRVHTINVTEANGIYYGRNGGNKYGGGSVWLEMMEILCT